MSELFIEKFQKALKPYAIPREQANYIRRIIALHLRSGTDGPVAQPLALADRPDNGSVPSSDIGGAHSEYLDALKANLDVRRQFEELVQMQPDAPERQSTAESEDGSFLSEHLAILKLQEKRDKLSVVRKYLDLLVDQPAASPDFLDPNRIFDGSLPLPAVPQEVVDGLVAEDSSGSPDLQTQVNHLEKIVIRSKILLRQEEKLLEEAKARTRNQPAISSTSKMEALHATRAELIGWIESELSEASTEGPAAEGEISLGDKRDVESSQADVANGLRDVKEKYSRYLHSRKELLSLISEHPHISQKPELNPGTSQSTHSDDPPPPINHLLIPYIERLLKLGKSQKDLIAEKSHVRSSLGKQARSYCEGLGHLAEESQLLAEYPMKDSLRRRSGLVDELMTRKSDVPDISKRIKPWVFASDSAKIANLESVTETIEEGQLALEGVLEAVKELEGLLGLTDSTAGPGDVARDENLRGKHLERQVLPERKPGDAWSILHGSLGLIGQDDVL